MVVPDFGEHSAVVSAAKVGQGSDLGFDCVLDCRQRVSRLVRRYNAGSLEKVSRALA